LIVGQLFEHVLEIHPAYSEATSMAKSHKMSIYQFLNWHLEQMCMKTGSPSIPYLARYFFFYGDLFGNRSPIADPLMSGSVVGLNADKSVDSLAIQYYGVIEFLALQTHQIITELNTAGHEVRCIFMSGSQCQNELLRSITATVCNMPVIIPRYENAAVCYGAAILAAKASTMDAEGNTENIWSVMQRLSKSGLFIAPEDNADIRALLKVKYQVFLEQCARQQVFREMVDRATAKSDTS
jgi:ribulose kinase